MTPVAASETPPPPPAPVTAPSPDQIERGIIDASTRGPVLTFYSTALLWLLVSSVLSLIASIKLHDPEFLAGAAWLTYGRIRPAQMNALLYGWASLAGIGTAIWIMARLSRVRLRYPFLVTIGAILWNLGLVVGTIGILAGDNTSFRWLEYPIYAALLIFVGFVAIGSWAVIMYQNRRPGHMFISQWYILAAFFCFPWLYAVANLMLLVAPVPGVVQAAVQWWFGGNLLGLWIIALGLAVAYYMIPKVIGRPIYSYYLASFGFWTFLLFYSWRGMPGLVGSPLPAWTVTVSIVATVLTIIPVATVALNHHMTMRKHFFMMHHSPTLRFVVIGAMAYTFSAIVGIVLALRGPGHTFNFTYAPLAHTYLELYAFFSMVMFGSIYFIVPRLAGCEWRSSWLIKIHFWGSAYGVALLVFVLGIGGLVHGVMLNDPQQSFRQVLEATLPYLRGRTLAEVLLLIGHSVFAVHFAMMALRLGRPGGAPTLLFEKKEAAK